MTIMVAGGVTFAVPGVTPVAYAEVTQSNPHLYVSAEGQDADNQFAQGNIIEVIVRDSTIGDTDEGEAEPDVTINGADLRMLQTGDGNWRAYFAQADAIAAINGLNGQLDYGIFCPADSNVAGSKITLTDSNGVYFPPDSTDCSVVMDPNNIPDISDRHPLIREPRPLTDYRDDNSTIGQLGLENRKMWPFIQVFDFAPESDVRIVYEKGGTPETVTLVFDDPSESHSLDRDKYPQGAHVLVTIEDYALNIDPTDEDTWAFDTANKRAYYNLFDEDGTPVNIMNAAITDYAGSAGIGEQLSIERSGQGGAPLLDCQVTKDFGIQDADDASMDYLESSDESNGACVPTTENIPSSSAAHGIFTADNFVVGFVEDGSNTNEFINWAEDQRANLVVPDDAQRNRSFEIDYNAPGAISGVVGHFFAELTLGDSGATWNSGERIGFTVTDEDANTNPLAENDLTVANPDSMLVPSIRIGDPTTLSSATGNVVWVDLPDDAPVDSMNPVITITGDNPAMVGWNTSYTDAGATCTDTVDSNPTIRTTSNTVDLSVAGSYTVTYTCTDDSNNSATATRTVTVTSPVITITGDASTTVAKGAPYNDAGATCVDDVDGAITTITTTPGAISTANVGEQTITYTCTDSEGNTATAMRTVMVTDQAMPIITIRGGSTATVAQGATYNDAGATCVDADDQSDITAITSNASAIDTSMVGTQVIQYSCTDAQGNTFTQIRTVTIEDKTPPVITITGDNPDKVSASTTEYSDELGATCTDNADEDKPANADISNVDRTTVGNYTVTYTCTDDAGNAAKPAIRTVSVERDGEKPVITVNGDNPASISHNAISYDDAGATCTDNLDADKDADVDATNVDRTTLGPYTVVFSCVDEAGNVAVTVTRDVNVVPDVIDPVINVTGEVREQVITGATYTDKGATCTDDVSASLSTFGDQIDTTAAGMHTVTYTCTDSSGNSDVATRTVTVIDAPDTEAPIITLNGADAIKVIQDRPYAELGAVCTDNVDADKDATATGMVDIATLGNYTITYSCTDDAGNPADEKTRTVEVIARDTDAPTITLNGDDNIRLTINTAYEELGAVCTDNVDADKDATVTGMVDTATLGDYTITYSCTDAENNMAENKTRTVTVVERDNEKPIITLNGDAVVTLTISTAYEELGAVCKDNVDDDKPATVTGMVDTATTGDNTITYSCSDSSGNNADKVIRTVKVVPNKPTLTLTGITGTWANNEVTLIITGTSMHGPEDVKLHSADIDYTSPKLDVASNGDITGTVTIEDISISDETNFMLIADGGIESDNMTGSIPRLLTITSHELASSWTNAQLALNVSGTSSYRTGVVLVVSDGDEQQEFTVTVTDGSIAHQIVQITNTAFAGKSVDLHLEYTNLQGKIAKSAVVMTEELDTLFELDDLNPASYWDGGVLKVALQGTSGVTSGVSLIAEDINGYQTTIGDVVVNDGVINHSGGSELELSNVTLAGQNVAFKLEHTEGAESNDKTRNLPKIMQLESVNLAQNWVNGELKIEIQGFSNSTDVPSLYVFDSEGNEAMVAGITVETGGTISNTGSDALTFSNMTFAEKVVSFQLRHTVDDAANNKAISNEITSTNPLPDILNLRSVTPAQAGWSASALSLSINGDARVANNANVALVITDAQGNTEEITIADASGELLGAQVSLANVTFADKMVSAKLRATVGDATDYNVATSSDIVQNIDLDPLVVLTSVNIGAWDNNALTVNITGTSGASSAQLVAIDVNMTESNVGSAIGPTTRVEIDELLLLENVTLAGESVTFKLKVEGTDHDKVTPNIAYSNNIGSHTLPPLPGGTSVDLTPTPVSFSTNSGFPPITRAVINDVSEIPAIHSVLKVIPADKTVGYDFSASNGVSVESFSDRLRLAEPTELVLDIRGESAIVIEGWERPMFMDGVTTLFNWNFDSLSEHATVMGAYLGNGTHKIPIATGASGLVELDKAEIDMLGGTQTDLIIKLNGDVTHVCSDITLVADFFTFGQTPDGDRVNNAIYRLEVEEATPNSADFEATLEYVMLNQLNVDNPATYTNLRTIDSDVSIIVHEDFTDEDSVRINYLDLGADGVSTQIAIQREAPTHSGVVSFDMDSYKIADTVTITLEDADLNVDNDVVDIYTFDTSGTHPDMIGDEGAFILDVTFDDEAWTDNGCGNDAPGFSSTGFTLMETASGSGVFTGDFQIPEMYCQASSNTAVSVTGVDIEVNYQDFRDASGEEIEVGAGAAIRANTGTVSLDRTVYPVPFDPAEYGTATDDSLAAYDVSGDLGIHIRVTDADFDVSAAGEDTIVNASEYLTVKIIRGAESTTIDLNSVDITEVAPDAGVFELDLTISHNVGGDIGQIQQGDIIQVEYEDPTDASGEINTVTDSATFDLRNAVLQSDKSVYIIGSDMILTLIEPDFDLDNDGAETYPLDLIEWDSDAATVAMGSDPALDPEPNGLRETGDSTGIFQSIIEIPGELEGDRLERGEEIELEYVDYGPSGSDYVGDETEDITLTVFTSNFGATIELDQKVYTWTDKVYITIVAPDHNFDSALVDEIGESDDDPIRISTRSDDIDNYKLVETGADTGIFTGEIILIGFDHNADGETTTGTTTTGYDNPQRETSGSDSGPTNGYIKTDDDDGITVSFEFSEDETVIGSALIRWNIGEVQWLEASYPATGTGVVRVIDPDMNLNPESVDNFDVDVWSDKDAGGIDLTVTETNQATGIFEGTVFFTTADESSGHRLRVAEGDTVTAEYEDNTLPDPYTTADELDITATTLIGTIVPPLERAVVSNLRTVDAFENSLDTVSVDQQVQIVADLTSGQDRSQMFAYLVQVQDANGVTVSLAWISGTLEAGQSLSPSSSWIPTEAGTYTATAFVWESVDNPTALSPPVTTTITVS